MRIVWLALAFVGTLAVGLLLGLLLGAFGTGGVQGSTPPPRTVTVEKTVPTRETPKPATTTPTHGVVASTKPAQLSRGMSKASATRT